MPFNLRQSGFAVVLAGATVAYLIFGAPQLASTQSSSPQPSQRTSSGQVLRAESNMVLVRVVVRDAHGKPVTGLTKKDFEVTDDKKRQAISYFAVEAPGTADAGAPAAATSGVNAPASGTTNAEAQAPQRYSALFFDDYHMEFGDLVQVREAAQRLLSKTLERGARVAILTASGKPFLEFTDDRQKLLQALSELHFDTRFEPKSCPKIPLYFAQMVVNDVGTSSIPSRSSNSGPSISDISLPDPTTAVNENRPIQLAELIAGLQHCPANGPFRDEDIQSRARNMLFEYDLGVQETLIALNNLIRRMSETPGGQRTIALVSDGFFGRNLQYRMDSLIDNALRSNVIVNSLDARGLFAEPPGGDISQQALPPEVQIKIDDMNHLSKQTDSDPLNEVAQSTGGLFVQNTNDMEVGLAQISSLQTPSYVLGFSPENLKSDGRFHSLHVKVLASGHYNLQARRGYFAPQKVGPVGNAEKEKIEAALFSQQQISDLPIRIRTISSKAGDDNATLSVTVDADMQSVRFLKQDGRNDDDVTLTVVVFNSDGNYVAAKQQTTKLRLTDVALADLKRGGGETSVDLTLRPGTYIVRAVVGESASSQIGAASQSVKIP
ncbi:MAG TPA: VWA domain-containing protein [Candidatus Acidoferrales bacterium]|nr:VWA domain-containing protein [Candidatus Acidoferrales bacterium]